MYLRVPVFWLKHATCSDAYRFISQWHIPTWYNFTHWHNIFDCIILWDEWGSALLAPTILNLGVRLRWVVSFTLRPVYLQRSFRYPVGRRLGGPQSQFGRDGEEKIPCLRWESNLCISAHSQSLHLIELSRLTVCYDTSNLFWPGKKFEFWK
jgi:hypothetical protein